MFTRINQTTGTGEGIGCVLDREGDAGPVEVTVALPHHGGREPGTRSRFDDCELPLENLILQDDGFKQAAERLQHPALPEPVSISLGMAEGAFEESVRYMRDRSAPSASSIGDFQGMRWKLAEMYKRHRG